MRIPQPEHFDLNLEVRVPNNSPCQEENAIGKADGNIEKGEAQKQMSVFRQVLCRKDLALESSSVKATSGESLSPLSWMPFDLLSQSFTLLWLTSHSQCHLLVIICILPQVDLQAWHVLATNLNIFCMIIIFFFRKKYIGI